MKHLAAFLLLGVGGNSSPSAKDVKKVLAAVGIEADDDRLKQLISELEGKDINEVRFRRCCPPARQDYVDIGLLTCLFTADRLWLCEARLRSLCWRRWCCRWWCCCWWRRCRPRRGGQEGGGEGGVRRGHGLRSVRLNGSSRVLTVTTPHEDTLHRSSCAQVECLLLHSHEENDFLWAWRTVVRTASRTGRHNVYNSVNTTCGSFPETLSFSFVVNLKTRRQPGR